MFDLAIATCDPLPEPDPDAAPLAAALEARGVTHVFAGWKAADPWPSARATLLRATWDYPWHPEAFRTWLDAVASRGPLWNSADVVRWNLHKRYLLDLEAHGLPVTPTELVTAGATEPLDAILERRGWTRAVVKPAVSAGSYRTCKTERGDPVGAAHLRALAAERDVLVQQFLPSVDGYGERALVWIDGEVTHAVRKSPRFEGEDESVSEAMPITDAERELAHRAVATVPGDLLYARVDVAPGADETPVIMELELVEPSLFFPQGPEALERFADAVVRRLGALR